MCSLKMITSGWSPHNEESAITVRFLIIMIGQRGTYPTLATRKNHRND
ncbi:Uncharacterised protein [Yersinia aldovae]|uniref:Uncharacterized protein n=1 Tax=Yersinia aldovae TaxID=29483 RepID=A0ABM9SNG8_YERAL|nr:Uncharacterised protein [Yersinia aldovae]